MAIKIKSLFPAFDKPNPSKAGSGIAWAATAASHGSEKLKVSRLTHF